MIVYHRWAWGVLLTSAIVAGRPAYAACEGDAANGFTCTPAGPVAIGAVFAADSGDARRNISITLVNELLEEEGEEIGQGAGDALGFDLFASVLYGNTDQDTSNIPGYESDTWGGTVGVRWRGVEWFAGAAVDYSTEDADFDNDAGGLNTDELGFQVFGTWLPAAVPGLFATAAVRYASLDIDTSRRFVSAPDSTFNADLVNVAKGNTGGSRLSLLGGAGYNWVLPAQTVLVMSAWLAYNDYAIDGYRETGALPQSTDLESGNLVFADDDYSTLDGMLSLGLSRTFPTNFGRIVPELSFSYVHEFESPTRTIDAALVDVLPEDPENRNISFRTYESDEDYFRLGAAVTAELNTGTSLFLTYSGTAGHDLRQEHLVTLGVNHAF
ncbi:autotransporter outer membrane beta-barrel domain-containing protein [Thiohalocapsa sp.]|jgi:outer membrane autotransporter protein|uniref:autotransporter outer membrane beta-barrel domain-containing protein n=1 Tax=Thiohalocapsa sp. TaxID=2497641 RepID=UPI0025CF35C0|nr:autotransporter outer membrane beta-barrel domain-containing protein [Thiohalocapsa sp.]